MVESHSVFVKWSPALLNWYFRLNFLAIVIIGIGAYQARIPNYRIIPFAVVAYSAVLIPRRLPRLIIGYAVLLAYPFAVRYNGYGYSMAMQSWLPVLIHLFFVSLEKPNLRAFALATGFHVVVLALLFPSYPHPTLILDLLGVASNVFPAFILIFFMALWIENARLSASNRALADKHLQFSQCLKRVVASVLHDLARWTALSKLGLTLSSPSGIGLHDFIRRGVEGANDLALRIKETIHVDNFAFLENVPLEDILSDFRAAASSMLPVTVSGPSGFGAAYIHADRLILKNTLLNLAENAAKAKAGSFKLRIEVQDDRMSMEALDDGRGFPPDILGDLMRHPVPSLNGGSGTGLLNTKFNLAFIGAEIHLADANTGGGGETRIQITGLRLAGELKAA
jgi:signal transduction histidine kinase